jgi:hypothetical protein
LLVLTDASPVACVPTVEDYTLLLSAKRPEAFLATLRQHARVG